MMTGVVETRSATIFWDESVRSLTTVRRQLTWPVVYRSADKSAPQGMD